MDVSHGLIIQFVKCKSLQRAVAPIASQVSLLILLTEKSNKNGELEESGSTVQRVREHEATIRTTNITACASSMAASVDHFIALGEQEAKSCSDELFRLQMSSACEILELAKTNLFVWSQRYEAEPLSTRNTRTTLCQAAKDVLQGVLKVLLVLDDRDVRSLIAMVTEVQTTVNVVARVSETAQLVPAFKALTKSVLGLKQRVDQRRKDLCSEDCSQQLAVAFNVLQKSVPSLSVASQTSLKYRNNVSAQASKESVIQEMLTTLESIQRLLQFGPEDRSDEMCTSFVTLMDNVISILSEDKRMSLDADIEPLLVSLVRHSMAVGHYASNSQRDTVVSSCLKILHTKFQLFQKNAAMMENVNNKDSRSAYSDVCETLLDELCELEKNVNMTLLQLVVDTFMQTTQPLDNLVKMALAFKDDQREFSEVHSGLVSRFTHHADSVCQISQLLAASSTDVRRVREILTSIRCLEVLDPDILPVVLAVARDPSDGSNIRHLRLLSKRWRMEVDTIVRAVDNMADPCIFLDMTEAKLRTESQIASELFGSSNQAKLKNCISRCLQLAMRATQVGERIVDGHSDPIYRNGLMSFVRKLTEACTLTKAAAVDVLATSMSSRLTDTLERRLCLLQTSVAELRQGLDVKNHPHLLSDRRKKVDKHKPDQLGHGQSQRPTGQILDFAAKVQSAQLSSNKAKPVPLIHTTPTTLMMQAPEMQPIKVENAIPGLDAPDNEPRLKLNTSPTENVKVMRSNGVANVQSWPPTVVANVETVKEQSSDIELLVRRLFTACTSGDKISTGGLTSELLGWTSHIVEAGDALMSHCGEVAKASELKSLVRELDQLAREVIEKAKFVVSGDKAIISDLLTQAEQWAGKLERARIIVDVAADRWLMLTGSLTDALNVDDGAQLKVLATSISKVAQVISSILLKTRFLTGQFLDRGKEKLDYLSNCQRDIEGLAVTITTTVDVSMVSVTRTASDRWQLLQVCREWSVLMTCAVSEIDSVSDKMESLGREAFPLLCQEGTRKDTRLGDILQAETDRVLELVDCVVCGDETLKERSSDLVSELNSALADVWSIVKQPVAYSDIPEFTLLSRLRMGLAKSRWIEKALCIKDLIQNSSWEFSVALRQLLKNIKIIHKAGLTPQQELMARDKLCREFLELSSNLKQKALAAIQTCTDLPRRAVVRSTLDDISKQTSPIIAAMKGSELTEGEVNDLCDLWGARVRKLLVNLRKMDDVRLGLVKEIEKIAKGGSSTLNQHDHPEQLSHSLQQPLVSASGLPRRVRQQVPVPTTAGSDFDTTSTGDRSASSSSERKSVQVVVRDAKSLDLQLHKWMGQERGQGLDHWAQHSKVMHSALDMAHLCSEMALFTKGGGSFQQSHDVVEAAVTVTQHAQLLGDFASTLLSLIHRGDRAVENLQASKNQVISCASQLQIITTGMNNSAESCEGNRILVKNAANLLKAVRGLFAVVEGIAVRGVEEPEWSDEKTQEVVSLLSRLRLQHEHYLQEEMKTLAMDELGLRRVELHNPPTLTSLVDT